MAKKKKTAKVVKDEKVQKIDGSNQYVIVKDETRYTFTNLRPGPLFFTRENGKQGMFEGNQTLKDITEEERERLLETEDYSNGWLVEESDEINKINNKNALNTKQLQSIFNRYKKDTKGLEDFIREIDSEFALRRIKHYITKKDMPSSLLVLCDFQLKKMQEEYEESQKAPDVGPSKEIKENING